VLRFSLLGSGSKGNTTLIVSNDAKILIDGGFSLRQLNLRLAAVGQSLEDVDAVFVTHEHSDHVGGLGVLARNVAAPVYMTAGTYESLPPQVGALPRLELFEAGDTIAVKDLRVSSFSVSHDAADPVAYTINANGAKLGLAADLGHPSQLVRSRLAGSHALVLESNYCPDMLRRGDYPPQVQQRIRSRVGHLSNQDMTSLLSDLIHEQLRMVVLVHLSENNNEPELVRAMAARALNGHPAEIVVAMQDAPTRLFEVSP